MRSYQQLFAELKRRKVFRVMAVYGIVGFIVLQIVDLAVPALLLPEWTYRLVALILLVGFPVAVVLAWAFESTPEGVRRTTDASPGEIEAIVAAPASQRIPSGLMALVGIAALVFGAYWIGSRRAGEPSTARSTASDARLATLAPADDERPSIAVLPFVNMSGDEEQENFSDGMTEEIGTVLVKTGQFRVQGRTSAFAYKGENADLRTIGGELGVAYLIDGSVRKNGGQLRITAMLIDAANGTTLWSDNYERPEGDVFDIQTEIAEAIANELKVPLGLDETGDFVTPTADFEAYELYLAGRAEMRRRGDRLNEAVKLFEAAIARDSTFAPAWAALAEASEISVWYPDGTYDQEDDIPDSLEVARFLDKSEVAARRALVLDPDNASALVALASVHRDRARWSEADRLYHQALDIDPENAEAHQQYAELLAHRGRIADAVREIDRAAWLDPAPVRLLLFTYFLGYDDRWDEALAVLRYGVERDPDSNAYTWSAAQMFARSGDTEVAVRAMEEWLRNHPPQDSTWTRQSLESAARGLATGELELPTVWELGPRELMWIGRTDSAVVMLVQSSALMKYGLPYDPYIWSPEFGSVRSDPRLQAYMKSLGLSDAVLQRTPVAERTRPKILDRAP